MEKLPPGLRINSRELQKLSHRNVTIRSYASAQPILRNFSNGNARRISAWQ